jgi:hypothetical protein
LLGVQPLAPNGTNPNTGDINNVRGGGLGTSPDLSTSVVGQPADSGWNAFGGQSNYVSNPVATHTTSGGSASTNSYAPISLSAGYPTQVMNNNAQSPTPTYNQNDINDHSMLVSNTQLSPDQINNQELAQWQQLNGGPANGINANSKGQPTQMQADIESGFAAGNNNSSQPMYAQSGPNLQYMSNLAGAISPMTYGGFQMPNGFSGSMMADFAGLGGFGGASTYGDYGIA